MIAAAIVATFDQPRALDLALIAWARQTRAPRFVIVADDGSGPGTAEVVRRHGAEHVRLDRGERFGKCRTVNAAIRHARALGADWLLFTDGDCLPAADLLARHAEESRAHRFVAGGVIRLPREVSEALTAADVASGAFERLPGNKPHYAWPRPIGHLLDRVQSRRAPWKGGNSSAYLEDVVRVGGYDERFGWGWEDKELGFRLEHAGVHGHSIRYTAPVFHLWHERPWADLEILSRNEAMLEETKRLRADRTEHGIDQAAAPGVR
jgi:glycosyltransferase involved in cell wall biosynthesis